MCEAGVLVHILRGDWDAENVYGLEDDEDALSMWEFDDALVRGNVLDIPEPDESFHMVSMFGGWDRIDDWDRALQEMSRVTKLLVITSVPEDKTDWYARALRNGLLVAKPFNPMVGAVVFKKELI